MLPVAANDGGTLWAAVWRRAGAVSVTRELASSSAASWRVVGHEPDARWLTDYDLGEYLPVGWGGLSIEAAAEALALSWWLESPLQVRYLGGSAPGTWRQVQVTRLMGTAVRVDCPGRGTRTLRLDLIGGIGDLGVIRDGGQYRRAR